MRMIFSTLLAEGPNDEALTEHLTWLLTKHLPNCDVQRTAFVASRELEGVNRGDLTRRMRIAVENHPCDILFVHRDADNDDAQDRHDEIRAAAALVGEILDMIAVVPVWTLEAWLLFDAEAIYRAVGRKPQRGLHMPQLRRIEQLANPKHILQAAFREANGGTGRRRESFMPHQTRYYLALASELAARPAAFEPLLDPRNNVVAFQRLSQSIAELVERYSW